MKLKIAVSATLALAAVSACATQPNKIAATYVSPMIYKDYDCDQITLEQNRIERRTGELYASLKKEANADGWQMGLGLLIFWPTLFMLEGGDGPEATEYARLRGEYDALNEVSISKKCAIQFREDLAEVIKEANPEDAITPGE